MDQPSFKNSKFLVVDDFEVVRHMIKTALTGLGYTNIDEAEDGRVAMTKIIHALETKSPYALVFCDWNMPIMTGIEVIEACRKNQATATLPIVMVTAEAEQECVIRAIRAGANDYLVKPISAEILEKKVIKILNKINQKAA